MKPSEWVSNNRHNIDMRTVESRKQTARKLMRACNMSQSEAGQFLRSITPKDVEPTAQPLTRGRTLQDFRRKFDIPLRIREGIKKHLRGVYMTDQEFREACGVPSANWRRYADADEFRSCRGRFAGELLWAQSTMMSEMKNTAGLPEEA